MNRVILRFLLAGFGILLADRVAAQGTAFTYQGALNDTNGRANGVYDLSFSLYATSTGGAPVGVLTNENLAVSNGLFTTVLDFGEVFHGSPYWLEIGVRPGISTSGFAILSPRQFVSPAPYAIYAGTAGAISGVTGILTNLIVTTTGGLTNKVTTANGSVAIQIGDTNALTLPLAPSFSSVTATDSVTLSSGAMTTLLQERDPGGFPFPVATLRPAKPNLTLAFDLMPNMTGSTPPTSGEGLITWFDVCDTDCAGNNTGPVGTARVAIAMDHVEFGSAGYFGGTSKPLWFMIGPAATPVMTLANSLGAYVRSAVTGGVTLDGTAAPAYVLRTNGVTLGNFGAATAAGQWFSGAVPGDVILRAETGNRVLLGSGSSSPIPAVVIDAAGNVGIGTTNALTADLTVNGNAAVTGTIAATAGMASYATNLDVRTDGLGWTNTWGLNAYLNIFGEAGTYVFYNRSGPGGATVCGTAVFTNTVFPEGAVIPVPANCGIAVRGALGVVIQAYAQ